MKKETIEVAFITDEKFAVPTGVAIYSLLKHRAMDRQYNIYILCNKVSHEKKQYFHMLEQEEFKIHLINVEGIKNYSTFSEMKYARHVSTTALYKFNLPNILSSLNKVLYIDGDVIIRDSLESLYDIDISDRYAAVCKDIGGETVPSFYASRLNIDHSAYFNSGVMLLNLTSLRRDNIPEKLLEYKENGINHYMDQDSFNVVFDEKVEYFSFLYNMALSCWRSNDLQLLNEYYGLEMKKIEEFYLQAKILHLSSNEKPWLYYNVIASEEWLVYFMNSPFAGTGLFRKQYVNGKMKLQNGCIYSEICYLESYESNEEDVLISVIIPCYNAEQYLPCCIESLMGQSLSSVEFIFVDDGSSDSTLDILKHYKRLDNRIKVFQQKNSYAGVARNHGITYAIGQYITFLDSDDIMLPDALQSFYEQAEKTKADIIFSSAYTFNDDIDKRTIAGWCLREKFLPTLSPFSIQDYSKYIFQVSAGAPWGKFFRRGFIDEHKLHFPDTPRGEDFFFVGWAFAVAQKISPLKKATILYRMVSGNGSLEDAKDKFPLAPFNVRKQLWNKLNEIGVYKSVEQSFVNNVINAVVYNMKSFKTGTAFETVYSELKNEIIPLYKINLDDSNSFYSSDEYEYVKALVESSSCTDYLLNRWHGAEADAKYYLYELNRLRNNNTGNKKLAPISHNARYINELEYYKYEVSAIRASASYRIGRFITFVPRKIRGGVRCYRENGLGYTMQRVKEKFSDLLGGKKQ